jgi:hypothetical protein
MQRMRRGRPCLRSRGSLAVSLPGVDPAAAIGLGCGVEVGNTSYGD